mmetsp:Transcript_32253/g.73503  ORF Transcript_32253/g.73503 Transcript_32253/m.73503 type:complete len:203 (+) Transcript_32253:721-1329(+)
MQPLRQPGPERQQHRCLQHAAADKTVDTRTPRGGGCASPVGGCARAAAAAAHFLAPCWRDAGRRLLPCFAAGLHAGLARACSSTAVGRPDAARPGAWSSSQSRKICRWARERPGWRPCSSRGRCARELAEEALRRQSRRWRSGRSGWSEARRSGSIRSTCLRGWGHTFEERKCTTEGQGQRCSPAADEGWWKGSRERQGWRR